MWVGMDSDFNIDGNIFLEILDTKTDSELVENFPKLTYEEQHITMVKS